MKWVKYRVEGRVGFITLSRPEKKNALNDVLVQELKSGFIKAFSDEHCKVVVLEAEGDVFSAGADLSYLKQLQTNSFQENLEDSRSLAALFELIYEGPKVVIASIQGHAIAGGCGLATVCDLSIASEEASFGYTEVKIGFIPAIVSYFLLRKIGESKTRELLLTGKVISAQLALEIGLINDTVPRSELQSSVLQLANKVIDHCSSMSLASTKKLISGLYNLDLKEAMQFTSKMNAEARSSKDCARGINAFLNKEKITW